MNDTYVDFSGAEGPADLPPYYRCRDCERPIEWFAPPGSRHETIGRGYGYWFHPDRRAVNQPGLECDPDDIDTLASPVVRIVEVVCTNDHCWVPGTPVVNSGGESNGQVLSENMCPICGDRDRAATYVEPVVFDARTELAEYAAWLAAGGLSS